MFFLLELECTFCGLEGNEIVGSYNLSSLGVPLSLLTIYNTNTKQKKTHTYILTPRVFTGDPKLSLPEIKFRLAITKIMFTLVFRNFVLNLWSTTPAFIKNLHAQMFPLRGFHLRVCITRNEISFLSKWLQ